MALVAASARLSLRMPVPPWRLARVWRPNRSSPSPRFLSDGAKPYYVTSPIFYVNACTWEPTIGKGREIKDLLTVETKIPEE
jgi:hypothetical protein